MLLLYLTYIDTYETTACSLFLGYQHVHAHITFAVCVAYVRKSSLVEECSTHREWLHRSVHVGLFFADGGVSRGLGCIYMCVSVSSCG